MTAPSDKELRELACNPFNGDEVRAMARELRAARKVVRAARRWRGYVSNATENKLSEAVAAYDKARKG